MISAAKKRCGLSDMTSLLNNGGPSGMCCFSSWASCEWGAGRVRVRAFGGFVQHKDKTQNAVASQYLVRDQTKIRPLKRQKTKKRQEGQGKLLQPVSPCSEPCCWGLHDGSTGVAILYRISGEHLESKSLFAAAKTAVVGIVRLADCHNKTSVLI